MNKKDIFKVVKDSVITGVCTAISGYMAVKLCTATDDVVDKVVEKVRDKKTIEDVLE